MGPQLPPLITSWTGFSEKALPSAPSILTPLRKDRRSAMSLSFNELGTRTAEQMLKDNRVQWPLRIPALIIMLLTAGVGALFLAYLATLKKAPDPRKDAFYVLEGSEYRGAPLGLTISTIITHMTSISAPLLVSVLAYGVAGMWLSAQAQTLTLESPSQPTPLQYALLVNLFSSPSPTSICRTGSYLASRHRHTPRLLKVAFGYTVGILCLSYLITLADVWLHATTTILPLLINSSTTVLITRYPLAPTITYLALLFTYSLLSGSLYIWIVSQPLHRLPTPDGSFANTQQLLHIHLTNAMTLVAKLFPQQQEAYVEWNVGRMFAESENGSESGTPQQSPATQGMRTKRLHAGIGGENGTFGVYERLRECPFEIEVA